ncbi:MAG: membrane dipeptidase [Bacteroidetes bacterium]|nr:MAG: membrane dipeptidase [Bacteroidota bacterium]
MKLFKYLLLGCLIITSCKTVSTINTSNLVSSEMIEKAKAIHKRVMTIDTHIDINVKNFTDEVNYTQDLDNQVTLPKMQKGGLDCAWFVVYTGQREHTEEGYAKAYDDAIAKFNAIHKLANKFAADQIGLATTSEEAREIYKSGKKVAMIGVENGYPIGTDLSRVKEFYDLGARYISLSHNGHSQLCDSHTGEEEEEWLHNGVSDFGKQVIGEMNKWGIMIDVSHVAKNSMRDMIKYSKAPIIASHSSARTLSDHSRNLDDEQLGWIKDNGGVVQAVAFNAYVDVEKAKKYKEAYDALLNEIGESRGFKVLPWSAVREMTKADREAYIDLYIDIRKLAKTQEGKVKKVVPPVNIEDFVDHIDYMVKKIGLEHVGISSDFDGGGGIEGWEDASETLNVTIELVKRGYTEEEIEKLWGGNLLRVLDEVQEVAKQIQEKAN